MNKTKKSATVVLAVAVVLAASATASYAQGGRRTTATQQQQQQEQTTSGTRNVTTTTGTATEPRQQTTTTRQGTQQVNTQQRQQTTSPANTSAPASASGRRQDATNAQRQQQQQQQQQQEQTRQSSQKQEGQHGLQPGSQTSGQKPSAGIRPGGSSTHQNGNGNQARPSGQAKPQAKPQTNPQGKNQGKNQKITPGYKPDAISHKPPKQPVKYKPGKYNRPAPYYDLGYHMFGTSIKTLPTGYVNRSYGGSSYYYYNGVFYRNNSLSGYVVCRPPVGFTFNALNKAPFFPLVLIDLYRDPATRISEAVSLSRLYARMHPGYRLLDETFYIDNVVRQQVTNYYGFDGIYYTISGGTYTVVNPPIGALTDRLPYDYEEIWLGGDLFYLVDNILYGVVAPEGVPYFEIFCVL